MTQAELEADLLLLQDGAYLSQPPWQNEDFSDKASALNRPKQENEQTHSPEIVFFPAIRQEEGF